MKRPTRKQNLLANVVDYLRLDLTGSDYNAALDDEIRRRLSPYDISPVIRGQKSPAAGAGLNADITASIVAGITSGLIVEAIKAIVKEVRNATTSTVGKSCDPGRITVETDTCDYIISACSGAGIPFENIDYSVLINRMMRLHDEELMYNRTIIRIEAPCEIVSKDCYLIPKVGIGGNYSLWEVTYAEGEMWPSQIYDASNECFVPLQREQQDAFPVKQDAFYHDD